MPAQRQDSIWDAPIMPAQRKDSEGQVRMSHRSGLSPHGVERDRSGNFLESSLQRTIFNKALYNIFNEIQSLRESTSFTEVNRVTSSNGGIALVITSSAATMSRQRIKEQVKRGALHEYHLRSPTYIWDAESRWSQKTMELRQVKTCMRDTILQGIGQP